ncbi:hypothetical protein [Pseudooceanicola sp. 200-1SW]|uniref:hypothetical protein n=1 Tax=Pseudooceanicola sp. 200-1SW TaxID=3425949 RepID=UPI003D7F3EC1
MTSRAITLVKTRAWLAGMQARHSPHVDPALLEQLRLDAETLEDPSDLRALILDFRAAYAVVRHDPEQRAQAGRDLVEGIRHLMLAEVGENARRITGE